MLRLVLFAFLALLLSMCASSKRYTLDELPPERLYFSFGGGFTGEYQEYLLLPNGQLFSRRQVINPLPYREYEPLEEKVAKDLFSTFEKQNFDALGFDDPGNMTYTIQHVVASDTATVVWGGTEVQPTEELRTYWRRLMQEVTDKKAMPATD